MAEKAEFWWISVGGAACEPAAVRTEAGKRVAYTLGCPDPFPVEDVDLVEEMGDAPETDAQEAARVAAWAAWERKVKRDAKLGIHHGYRGFRQARGVSGG